MTAMESTLDLTRRIAAVPFSGQTVQLKPDGGQIPAAENHTTRIDRHAPIRTDH
jgi:hypothetical protein